jgi:hypothetical protein
LNNQVVFSKRFALTPSRFGVAQSKDDFEHGDAVPMFKIITKITNAVDSTATKGGEVAK